MKRGLAPAFVIAQASAHSSPTLGNEFKVVNWLRAAAILAQIDPVSAGYLTTHTSGGFRLPALRKLADGLDLVAVGRTNPLAEHTLHKLSDVDFTFSRRARHRSSKSSRRDSTSARATRTTICAIAIRCSRT